MFKIRRDGTYRARLVALGYSQIPGVDYTDNFAPVAHDVSFRIALARMMVEKLDSLVMDVETAFQLEWRRLIQDHHQKTATNSKGYLWIVPSSKTVLEKVCGHNKERTFWIHS